MSWVGKWVGLGWVEVGKEEWGWVELRWAVGWVGVNRDGLGWEKGWVESGWVGLDWVMGWGELSWIGVGNGLDWEGLGSLSRVGLGCVELSYLGQKKKPTNLP